MKENLLSLVRGRQGHFLLESGHHGDLWYQLETLCLRSRDLRPFAGRLAAQLAPYEVEVVCGPLVEGAFVALMVSLELGCDFAYAERFADTRREGLFPVEYRLPKSLHPAAKSKRVAIVNDVINAGSAVRGTFFDLQEHGAGVVAIGALLAPRRCNQGVRGRAPSPSRNPGANAQQPMDALRMSALRCKRASRNRRDVIKSAQSCLGAVKKRRGCWYSSNEGAALSPWSQPFRGAHFAPISPHSLDLGLTGRG
jgi:orotate phosphoribosyltransferase